MTNRRQPASSAAARFGADRVAARRLDDDAGTGKVVGPMTARRRSAEDADAVAAIARRRLDRAAQRAVAEDRDVTHVVVPSMSLEGPPGSGGQGHEKAAVTVVVPRPLEPPFPGGPGSSKWTRRLEPQGPCLPAGPPELLLGLVREGAAVHAAILTHNGASLATINQRERRKPVSRRPTGASRRGGDAATTARIARSRSAWCRLAPTRSKTPPANKPAARDSISPGPTIVTRFRAHVAASNSNPSSRQRRIASM